MTATNKCYNFVGFGYRAPLREMGSSQADADCERDLTNQIDSHATVVTIR